MRPEAKRKGNNKKKKRKQKTESKDPAMISILINKKGTMFETTGKCCCYKSPKLKGKTIKQK